MLASSADVTQSMQLLDDRSLAVLAELSARALDSASVAGPDDVETAACGDALKFLANPTSDIIERLKLWLGASADPAARRARQLQDVLIARASLVLLSQPARSQAVLAALQRLAFLLGRLAAGGDAGEGDQLVLIGSLRKRLSALPKKEHAALLLVQCDSIDRLDTRRGHRHGDRLRGAIAQRLRKQVLRASDGLEPVSRTQFACFLHSPCSEGIAVLAAQKVLRVLEEAIKIGGEPVVPGAVVGIAMHPEHGHDADALLLHARGALRQAQDDPDRCALYRPDLPDAAADTLRYEERLRQAIRRNSLSLAFQPQSELRTGRIVGAEALLRWTDEELGVVPPNLAIAAAESSGLIHELTLWVITAAMQQCAEFRKLDPSFVVSVNVSPSDLRDLELPHFVDRALRTWELPGANLMFEITETAIVHDQKAAIAALEQLKKSGVGISIDDFGTGYSSMYYLAQMPLDELKIDLMFVRAMLEVPQNAKIVRSLVDLAHNLDLIVVAEGVEDEATLSALAHLGCDRAQGYFIGKPMPAEELAKRILRAA